MIKVFIIDDHNLIIEGISFMLQDSSRISLVGQASNVQDALGKLKIINIDVLLLDIALPDGNGIELCKKLKTEYPELFIIGLSTYTQESYVVQMIENGADGYLFKNADKNEIIKAIEEVYKGRQYLCFEAGKIYTAYKNKQLKTAILTKRELQILKMITEGYSNAQISNQLFISTDTVDTHRKNLYSKLNVNNTAQLIKAAIEGNYL